MPTKRSRYWPRVTSWPSCSARSTGPPIDDTGNVAWHTRTTLWGTTTWNRDAPAYTPLRFPGQYHDPETGLHYNYFRTYDPETGRYLSPDPLGLEPADNPATYVTNPHSWVDPLGLTPMDCETNGAENENTGHNPPDPADLASRINPDDLKMSGTVANHFDDITKKGTPARPYMHSSHVVREIMEGSAPKLDPRGAAGAVRWDTPGALNGRAGTWELVIDTNTNTILHFNFVR